VSTGKCARSVAEMEALRVNAEIGTFSVNVGQREVLRIINENKIKTKKIIIK